MGTHATTIELTKERILTRRGDCIIGVSATKSLGEFNNQFKLLVQQGKAIQCSLKINNQVVLITGNGHPNLTYTHPTDVVIRKSSFTCPRTVMIQADKAALDLPRDFIKALKDPDTKLECEFAIRD